jgi:glycosyltransferase involved in cell wall biosynthesis
MAELSVVIITFNEEQNIARCLDSVKEIANEIVVVDSYSTDRTVEICKSFNCRVIMREFRGYSDQKQFASDQAVNDWVFILDADEEITPELRSEISGLFENESLTCAGYRIPRSLFYLGRILRFSGVGEKPVLRIYNRQNGRFNGAPVHEEIIADGVIGTLNNNMIHYSYRDLAHHIQKINSYTTHAAEGYSQKGKQFSKGWVAFKFPVNFINYYFLRGGFLDGYPGFMWSFLAAFYGLVKLAKTVELSDKKQITQIADV